ncbi:MAG: hypothetical protein JRI23_05225 [Deltaproteobacteria bacterium]|jgi:hypothetical protein|nr:hypothetical protein [Deltaproteobacteria bacterium]MBW2530953.1 hypothetical protein [Deltaproteobacteria bacterium]
MKKTTHPCCHATLLALLLAVVPLGCDKLGLGKPTPEKVCEKGESLQKGDKDAEAKKESAKACVKSLTKIQKKSPEAFDCFAKCVMDAKDDKAMETCLGEKCGELLAKAAADDDGGDKDEKKKGNPKVDALTPEGVKSAISGEYQHYGYEFIKESSNSAGWSANFMLGKKGQEAQIYRVMLLKCSGVEDCGKVINTVYTEKQDAKAWWAEGEKQALYVECLTEVSSVSKEPGPCYTGGRHDDIVEELTK